MDSERKASLFVGSEGSRGSFADRCECGQRAMWSAVSGSGGMYEIREESFCGRYLW